MKVAVIGTGYVGLVAGVCFADAGHDVICVDTDAKKVARLEAGEVVIYEPGLADLMGASIREKRLSFTTNHAEAVAQAEVIFLAVGTPEGEGGAPDLRFLDAAAESVAKALTGPAVVVTKSTVPVGTAARLRALFAKWTTTKVSIVSNPEFLKEGAAVEDFLRPDRVVIGTDDDRAFEVMKSLYEPFLRTGKPIFRMSNAAAELTKYASNAMLATRISFMNEIARLCDKIGADVEDVRRGMGSDSRIGHAFLFPGCGYGGSCFPKDTQGLIHVGKAHGVEMEIAKTVEAVNDRQKTWLLEKIVARFGRGLAGKKFAIWGMAFKPRTDDVREAPAFVVAEGLLAAGANVVGSDPEAMETARAVLGDKIAYEADPYVALKGADALVLCTEWNEYRGANLARMKSALKQPVVFDGRNVFDPARMRAAGFEYSGIGR